VEKAAAEGIGRAGIEKSVARDSEMQLLDSGAKTTAANALRAEMLCLGMCADWCATSVVYICISLFFLTMYDRTLLVLINITIQS
jgi:hypothetical protein